MGIEITGTVGTMRRFLGVCTANVEKPEMVRDAHLAYIDAGAEIITTNTYACVPKCLDCAPDSSLNLQLHGVGGTIEQAGKCARESCRLRSRNGVKVAGSLPPLAESYRPDLVGPFEENVKQYMTIAKSIAPFADLLLCETMSTVDEARAAATAAASTGLPIWVSWTLDEKRPVLRSGESIQEAFEAVKNIANLQVCMFNCSSPEMTTLAIPILHKLAAPAGLRIGAYANGFVTAAGGSGDYRDLSPEEYYDEFASKWIESGATIVGGCCGIFPRHIAHLKQRVSGQALEQGVAISQGGQAISQGA